MRPADAILAEADAGLGAGRRGRPIRDWAPTVAEIRAALTDMLIAQSS